MDPSEALFIPLTPLDIAQYFTGRKRLCCRSLSIIHLPIPRMILSGCDSPQPITAIRERAQNERRVQRRARKRADEKETVARTPWRTVYMRERESERASPSILSGSVRNGASSVRREVNILSGEPRAVISSIRGPVESKSHSARSGPGSRASINILTYTTWNSRLIYCRYLDALVFGPPGGRYHLP